MSISGYQIPDCTPLRSAHQPIIWILGGPGSGKGTLCDNIVKHYKLTHISAGDLLRQEIANGSERGHEVKAIMERGELVPVNVVLSLIAEKMLSELNTSQGFLIDGYPRQKDQGDLFEKEIKPCSLVVYLEAGDEILIQRLLHRGKTSGRPDDNIDSIKKRLITFHDHSDPIVQNWKSKMLQIDATQTPDECFNIASEKLKQLIPTDPCSTTPQN